MEPLAADLQYIREAFEKNEEFTPETDRDRINYMRYVLHELSGSISDGYDAHTCVTEKTENDLISGIKHKQSYSFSFSKGNNRYRLKVKFREIEREE